MRNIKLLVAYMGTSYVGWQKTPMGPSIEETLGKALATILQQKVSLQAASRTDAGVHAAGQVVNVFVEGPWDFARLKHSLNCMLPKDISVLEITEMPANFHPTLDTRKKEYIYEICYGPVQSPFHRHTSWHFPVRLDVERMRLAASYLCGRHDFSAFCNARKLWDRDPICELEAITLEQLPEERLRIHLLGSRFLFRMARNLAGTLAYVGCGKIPAEQLPHILLGKDRTQTGVTAPAHGLTLKQVFY